MENEKNKWDMPEYHNFMEKNPNLELPTAYLLGMVCNSSFSLRNLGLYSYIKMELDLFNKRFNTNKTEIQYREEIIGYLKTIMSYSGPDYPVLFLEQDPVFYIKDDILSVGTYDKLLKQKAKSFKIIGDVFKFKSENPLAEAQYCLIPVIDKEGNKHLYFNDLHSEVLKEHVVGHITSAGEFEVNDKLMVSDPCYDVGTWCQGAIDVKSGTWEGEAFIKISDSAGVRTWYLRAFHKEHNLPNEERFNWENLGYKELTEFTAGVDAGMMAIFNYYDYLKFREQENSIEPNENQWNKFCEEYAPYHNNVENYKNKGVISSSGFGDGAYPIYARKVDGKIVDVVVEFIPIDENPEE